MELKQRTKLASNKIQNSLQTYEKDLSALLGLTAEDGLYMIDVNENNNNKSAYEKDLSRMLGLSQDDEELPSKRSDTYIVQPSDTIASIAMKHKMPLREFLTLNKLTNYSNIYPGKMLRVQHPPDSPTPAPNNQSKLPEWRQYESKRKRPIVFDPITSTEAVESSEEESVYKTSVEYCYADECIQGELTISKFRLIFAPDSNDPNVMKNGFLTYQLNLWIESLIECRADTDFCPDKLLPPDKGYIQLGVLESEKSGKILYFRVDLSKIPILVSKLRMWIPEGEGLTPTQLWSTVQKEKNKEVKSRAIIPKEDPNSPLPNIKVLQQSTLLTDEDIYSIRLVLPVRYQRAHWKLMYSTHHHGISLLTFFIKLKDCGPTVIVVEDSKRYIFGAFCSESWKIEPSYYGNGQSFLFKLHPKVAFYPWSGENEYFMLGKENEIAVGGGNGKVGLYLDRDFQLGISQSCQTFFNDILSSDEEFSCLAVEAWTFVTPTKSI